MSVNTYITYSEEYFFFLIYWLICRSLFSLKGTSSTRKLLLSCWRCNTLSEDRWTGRLSAF